MFVESYKKPQVQKYFTNTLVLRLAIFTGLIIWCVGFFAPSFHSEFSITFQPLLNLVYSKVCQQNPAKTFSINGSLLLVCARCTGIYLGAFFTITTLLFANLHFQFSKKVLIISGVPMLLDVIFYSVGLYHYSKIIAFGTGFLFGAVTMWFLVQFLEENVIRKNIYE